MAIIGKGVGYEISPGWESWASKELLVLILVLDMFPQLLHFKDKSHKLWFHLFDFTMMPIDPAS